MPEKKGAKKKSTTKKSKSTKKTAAPPKVLGRYEFFYDGKVYDLIKMAKDGILNERDFFVNEEEDLGIIKKQGIERLFKYFDLSFHSRPYAESYPYTADGSEIRILVFLVGIEDKAGRITWEYGEASPSNLKKGISADYPVSMGWKRAVGRCTRVHLGLNDWYTEDEANEFKQMAYNTSASGKTTTPPKKKKAEASAPPASASSKSGSDPFENLDDEDVVKRVSEFAKGISGMTKAKFHKVIRKAMGIKDDAMFVVEKVTRDQWVEVLALLEKE